MRNNKGFTLVELLAVIVILAILMVSAGAAVMSTLNNARVNTFKNEALSALDVADNMYTEISMDASDSNTYLKNDTQNHYKAMCVTLQGLVTNGYLDKDVGKDGSGAIRGVVLIEVPFDGTATKKTIWMTNSTHTITGIEESKISSLKFKNENNEKINGKHYWQTPADDTIGVVTIDTVADEVIVAANAKQGTFIDSVGGSTTNVEIYSGSSWTGLTDFSKGYTSSAPNVRLHNFHSPESAMGGTNAIYSEVICINSKIG